MTISSDHGDVSRRAAGAGDVPGDASADADVGLLYECLRDLAQRALPDHRGGHTLQPTALAHEAWLRLTGAGARWNDEGHMRGLVARTLRAVLVDHARRRSALKRGGGRLRVTLIPSELVATTSDVEETDLLALDAALDGLAARHERAAQVVELRFFGGLSVAETGRLLDVASSTVDDDWRFARAWLRRVLGR